MASSSKVSGSQIALIFFVMATFVSLGWAFASSRGAADRAVEFAKMQKDLQSAEDALRNALDDIGALREKALGAEWRQVEDVGQGDEENDETMLGGMSKAIRQFGGSVAADNMYATLNKLRVELNNTQDQLEALRQIREEQDRKIQGLEARYDQVVAEHQSARNASEQTVTQLSSDKAEQLSGKQAEIDNLRAESARLESDLATERDAHERDNRRFTRQITQLETTNDTLRLQLNDVTRQSFERPDGIVRWVDNLGDLVWINLGSADNLTERTTFSVYSKGHDGVGRGAEDIKASIEVMHVLEPHLSQARILDKDPTNPIASGDPIYSPLFNGGQKQFFSISGLIDWDGDGHSDRAELHNAIEAAGGAVDNEVDDEGNRTGEGITFQTKFLVVGEIPSPTNTRDDKEQERNLRIGERHKEMLQEALRHGVLVVRLDDFLAYIGHSPQHRLWTPGVPGRRWNLQQGAASTGVHVGGEDRGASSGQVSGAYSREGRMRQQPADGGTTSGLYK